ncbi:hypothetical protein PI23P_12037 [Polaribacter irgensii 23-P]|uniref:Lipoprotein n=1 Tax=Polaribacter irgensii 23-P TaxID=313594 RepID=A4C1R0_9FLAO|nr:hypothetical protein [Polaribacter irgensii]EAR12063.1 hypothetical protein PI23P_12037 [Polaribacter irgensii 23-P]
MIKKKTLSVLILATVLLMSSCGDGGKFNIKKGRVGHLTTTTTIQELATIFEKDSIVKNLSEGALGDNYFQDDDEYLIYEKGGKHILTIIPREQLDSTSTIKSIEVHDIRYATETGINKNSSFSEVNANNNINRVESTFFTATLFIDDLNATIAIDKEELGLKDFTTQKVTLEQIPDLAKMKAFIVWFN